MQSPQHPVLTDELKKLAPHIHLVPKDPIANARFRREMLAMGAGSKSDAMALWRMCQRDILFYLNTFGFLYEPRASAALPWITYPFQDYMILKMKSNVGKRDTLVKKSRDMGASWACLSVYEHEFHFEELRSFLLLSRIEELVDKTGNSKALFWKVDFLHQQQPKWLLPRMERQHMHLENLDLRSTIDGASTTGEAATGDRRTGIMLDEFAKCVQTGHAMLSSTRDATNSRIFNSTPGGVGDAFYEMCQTMTQHNPDDVITAHWSLHPEKSKGIWWDDGKKTHYKFRSPWYDNECKRTPNPVEISRELDIDFEGSDYQFFAGVFERLEKLCTPPDFIGDVHNTTDGPRFEVHAGGNLRLWGPVEDGRLKSDRPYVIGGDISMGTGASNSALSIVDGHTKKKVGEYTTKTMRPDQFADVAVRLAKWLRSPAGEAAFMIWERQGPGTAFGNRVLELGHNNVYFHRNEKTVTKKPTDSPGWVSTTDNKNALLSEYRRALHADEFFNPSAEAIAETRQFVCMATGEIIHVKSKNNFNPTAAGANHGDICISDALAWHAVRHYQKKTEENTEIPTGSLAHRRLIRLERRHSQDYW